jgi:ketosteroid isomerase-like protein
MTDPMLPFAPDAAGWARLFAAIDARDADAFAGFIAEGGEFRFGNAPPVVGRAAIRAAVAGFFAAIGGCRHRLLHSWTGPGSAVCEGEVTYTRLDGSTLTVPFANVFELGGGRIRSYRIYIDNGPLFSAAP